MPVLGSPGKLVSSSGHIEEQNDTQSKLLFPLEINCLSSETNDSSTLGENPEACPEVNKNKDNEGSDDDSIEDLEEDFENLNIQAMIASIILKMMIVLAIYLCSLGVLMRPIQATLLLLLGKVIFNLIVIYHLSSILFLIIWTMNSKNESYI